MRDNRTNEYINMHMSLADCEKYWKNIIFHLKDRIFVFNFIRYKVFMLKVNEGYIPNGISSLREIWHSTCWGVVMASLDTCHNKTKFPSCLLSLFCCGTLQNPLLPCFDVPELGCSLPFRQIKACMIHWHFCMPQFDSRSRTILSDVGPERAGIQYVERIDWWTSGVGGR